jgi:hypothetical protein
VRNARESGGRSPSRRRGLFEGDAAAIELRSRLAETREGAAPPSPRRSPRRAATALLRYTAFVLTAAAAAGVAGYILGSVRQASIAARRVSDDLRTNGTALFSASMPLPANASETVTRLKLGAELMAAGDVAAARMMFERVAESGDAGGAFALAETFDPAVLAAMRLRGSIAPDPALARRWYEKARDLGSAAAAERIARLAGR